MESDNDSFAGALFDEESDDNQEETILAEETRALKIDNVDNESKSEKEEEKKIETKEKKKVQVPDPDMSHITSADYKHVYSPSEDTFLVLDALNSDRQFLLSRFPDPNIILEIGVGSGILLTHASNVLNKKGHYIGLDINAKAARVASQTLRQNKVPSYDIIVCDLLGPVFNRLQGSVDLLIFNPPYVPTPSAEVDEGKKKADISAAWAGGLNGREVLDRILLDIPKLLSKKGVFYLVMVDENKPKEIIDALGKSGLNATLVSKRQAYNEALKVWRFNH
mmetsp:Transcript_23452/g.35130  ORF Transcript_23452/g.35130 Transcript_23452/m.35130 type:complete len:279 (-) Transcript_23452:78-914(-)|eukprot:CAMPEP_0167760422 /NCGR_PEP_ID=MMETSP0110_2-20121227/11579_1 /TAXON_ID=629695 /ORGANISM="Gymnochlora sp., Strain CCMP2014" /LENGTH=278 /DNA_ID=CAMNT_0007646935 /DNA_START=63 /DNA_END=899 /DNA_ORIENTATION=+